MAVITFVLFMSHNAKPDECYALQMSVNGQTCLIIWLCCISDSTFFAVYILPMHLQVKCNLVNEIHVLIQSCLVYYWLERLS